MQKNTNTSKATRTVYSILRQISTLVPREFVNDAAEGLKIKWRAFDPWSHLMTLVTVQLSRQESLNGICDIAKAIEQHRRDTPQFCTAQPKGLKVT